MSEIDMNTRGQEIPEKMKILYAELDKFSHPADTQYEYETASIAAFKKLKHKIRALENELAEITGQQSQASENFVNN